LCRKGNFIAAIRLLSLKNGGYPGCARIINRLDDAFLIFLGRFMASVIRTRFAPSPTGFLHVGNVRTALICWLFTRSQKGDFFLRLDDTDFERSEERFALGIQDDLKWLGLNLDGIERQSDRFPRYEEIKQQLIALGRLYPCYESSEELEIKRKIQLSRGLPPIYDRAALRLSDAEKANFEKEGRTPHWRFRLDETKKISWHDLIKGEVVFDAANLSDPVVIRANGQPTYLLPSAVDDMDMKITHIVRGEDHVTNTAIQLQMFEAMGASAPQCAHLALIKSKEGKISKREGGFDIMSLREAGIEPMTICSVLARVGTSQPIVACTKLEQLVQGFDFGIFSRSAAQYDFSELETFNAKIIQRYDYSEIKSHLQTKNLQNLDENFWLAVRGNLNRFDEIAEWWKICREKIEIQHEDADFLKQAAELLPDEPWGADTWSIWIEKLKTATGRKGKMLFMPLRLALTGAEHGPELQVILPLIGRKMAMERLGVE
jgi:glutamyl-tRNA synthetase